MIRDQHEISRPIIRIHAAGRIGQDQLLRPHKSHQSCGQHYVSHGIPFIVMHSSLHDDHRRLFHVAEYEPSFMARHCRNGKPFDLRIGNGLLDAYLIRIVSQPRSQNQRRLRLKVRLFPDALHAHFQFIINLTHS